MHAYTTTTSHEATIIRAVVASDGAMEVLYLNFRRTASLKFNLALMRILD